MVEGNGAGVGVEGGRGIARKEKSKQTTFLEANATRGERVINWEVEWDLINIAAIAKDLP